MSSDGSETSTGSRLRQFGLYRTIDARTEDFLRSSRKRQIRQGCACAAISTAITVTVVVSVILVYEFIIRSESNGNKKLSMRPNWLTLVNETELTQINLKTIKKDNLDRTTIKLLPILLKTLNKNKYLENTLDEYSSSSPAYEMDETETTFRKNIFSDSKNWLQTSSSKIYTGDHKTSSLIYLQRPLQHLDYLSRIRKSRNYQRMLNYFNKMVIDKVVKSEIEEGFEKNFIYTERSLKSTSFAALDHTSISATNHTKKFVIAKNVLEKNTEPNVDKEFWNNITTRSSNCKCPKNIGILFKKLLNNVENMKSEISHIKHSNNAYAELKLYKQSSKIQSGIQKHSLKPKGSKFPKKSTTQLITKSTKLKTTKPPTSISSTQKLPTVVTSKTILTAVGSHMTSEMQGIIEKSIRKIFTTTTMSAKINTITSIILPTTTTITKAISTSRNSSISSNDIVSTSSDINYQPFKEIDPSQYSVEVTSTPKSYTKNTANHELEPNLFNNETTTSNIDIDSTPRLTTELIIMPFKSHYLSPNEVTANHENTFDSVAIVPNYKHPIEPLFKDEAYDELTTINVINHVDKKSDHEALIISNAQKTEFSKNKENAFKNNKKKKGLKSSIFHPIIKIKDVNVRKMSDLAELPKSIIDDETTRAPNSASIHESVPKDSNLIEVNSTKSNKQIDLLRNFIKIQEPNDIDTKQVQFNGYHVNTENIVEDEFQDELITHRSEVTESYLFRKPEIIFNYDDTPTVQDDWDKVKSNDKINYNNYKSMLPSIKPIYLEVRRSNNWKTEAHSDYDINLTNNIFDLP